MGLINEYELEVWFSNLTFIDKLALYEGRKKLGVNKC